MNRLKRLHIAGITVFTILANCISACALPANGEEKYYNQMSDFTKIIYDKEVNLDGLTSFEKTVYDYVIMSTKDNEMIHRNARRDISYEDETVKPFVTKDAIMVPIKSLQRIFEYKINENDYYDYVEVSLDNKSLKAFFDKPYIILDGKELLCKQAAQKIGSEIYLSDDVLEKILGKKVFSYKELVLIGGSTYSIVKDKSLLSKIYDNYNNTAEPMCFYISAERGNDSNNGKCDSSSAKGKNGPVRTFDRAKEIVRKYTAKEMDRDIIVYLEGGKYILDKAINFTSKDSGNNWHNVIYRNYNDEKAEIIGATPISGWKKYNDNIYCVNVGDKTFSTLYEGETIAVEARWPNEGKYAYAIAYTSPTDNSPSAVSFRFDEDFPKITMKDDITLLRWSGGPEGHWYWNTFIHDVKDIDYTNRALTVTSGYGDYVFGTGTAYFVRNSFDLLDAPGEFYLDRNTGMLYYWPRGEFDESNIYLPDEKLSAIFTFEDYKNEIKYKVGQFGSILTYTTSDMKAHATKNITLDGLHMMYTDQYQSAVRITNGRNISVLNCKMNCIGESGVDMYNYAVDNLAYGNSIYNIGSAAIKMQDDKRYVSAVSRNDIINNHIYDTSQLKRGVSSIMVWDSGYNRINHNVVHDMDGAAINVSASEYSLPTYWADGYKYTREEIEKYLVTGKCNEIAYNDVYSTNRWRQDSGAIYTGRCAYNKVHDNSIHDTYAALEYSFALYIDDMSRNTDTYNNIVWHIQDPTAYPDYYKGGELRGVYVTKGDNSITHNNIAADCYVSDTFTYLSGVVEKTDGVFTGLSGFTTSTMVYSSRNEKWYGNICYNSGPRYMGVSNWTFHKIGYCDYNIYYNEGTEGEENYTINGVNGAANFKEWRALDNESYDRHTLLSNPKFVAPEEYDYRLRYDSPAYMQGFDDIDYEQMGLLKDFKHDAGGDSLNTIFVKTDKTHSGVANINMKSGEKTKLLVTGKGSNTKYVDLSDADISYTTSDANVAEVLTDGTVVAKNEGVSEVTVSVTKNGKSTSKKMYIIVDDEVVEIRHNGKVDNGVLTGDDVYDLSDETLLVTKYGQYIQGNERDIYFNTDDKDLGTLTNKGKIKINGNGQMKINISLNTSKGRVTKTINTQALESDLNRTYLNDDMYVLTKSDNELVLNGTYVNGKEANFKDLSVNVTVEKPELCKVTSNEGNVIHIEGLKNGITNIKFEFLYDGLIRQIDRTFFVADKKVTSADDFDVKNYDADGTVENSDNGIIIKSNGQNIWNSADQATYAEFKDTILGEEAVIVGKIDIVNATSSSDASVGLMMRAGNTAGAYNFNIRGRANGASQAVWRNAGKPNSGYVSATKQGTITPYYFALYKSGNKIYGYIMSETGWSMVKEEPFDNGSNFTVGLCAYGGAGKDEYIAGEITDLYIGY